MLHTGKSLSQWFEEVPDLRETSRPEIPWGGLSAALAVWPDGRGSFDITGRTDSAGRVSVYLPGRESGAVAFVNSAHPAVDAGLRQNALAMATKFAQLPKEKFVRPQDQPTFNVMSVASNFESGALRMKAVLDKTQFVFI